MNSPDFPIYMEKLSDLQQLLEEDGFTASLCATAQRPPYLTVSLHRGMIGEISYNAMEKTSSVSDFLLEIRMILPCLNRSDLEQHAICRLFNENTLTAFATVRPEGICLRSHAVERWNHVTEFEFLLFFQLFQGYLTQLEALVNLVADEGGDGSWTE